MAEFKKIISAIMQEGKCTLTLEGGINKEVEKDSMEHVYTEPKDEPQNIKNQMKIGFYINTKSDGDEVPDIVGKYVKYYNQGMGGRRRRYSRKYKKSAKRVRSAKRARRTKSRNYRSRK